MFRRLASLLVGLLLATLGTARAQTRPGARTRTTARVVDNLGLAFAVGPGGVEGYAPRDRIGVLVRLRDRADLDRLEEVDGLRVQRVGQRPLRWRRWVSVTVDRDAARALGTARFVEQVRVTPHPRPPLDRSAQRLGVAAARNAARRPDFQTGVGVRIGDQDSLVDVFHPDFFVADGGWFDWIDVDEDGTFSPGTDAIDLDRDGEASAAEIAQALHAEPTNVQNGERLDALRAPTFDPQIDWIYLDENGDGRRSYGEADGFDDADLAFGEPLFVPDDVDGDGRLDPEERLVRLGTSKFERVLVNVDFGPTRHVHEYVRGVDLASTPSDVTGGIYGYADTLHASGVFGILAGGVPLPSRRWVGIAPGATLLSSFNISSDTSNGLLWLFEQNVDVALHEYVLWTRIAMDGSDVYSALIDESAEAGVANICPGGNIGGTGKHAEATLGDGESVELEIEIVSERSLEISLHGLGDGALEATLISGDSDTYPISAGATSADSLVDGGTLYTQGSLTSRGTQFQEALFVDPPSLERWRLRVRAVGGPLVVHAWLGDEYGFATSSAFRDASDRSTIAAPATSDRCLAVGAIPSHLSTEDAAFARAGDESENTVRAYSARGPRIDGELRPHIVAPDNPLSALGAGEILPFSPGTAIAAHGAYSVFGGTSGAGPHVAGVAALLVEDGLSGDEVLTRIRERAIADPVAGILPNDDYGFGRLAADVALDAPGIGAPPSVSIEVDPPFVAPNDEVSVRVIVDDPDGEPTELRWDYDYDGEFDTPFGSTTVWTSRYDAPQIVRLKVRVRDSGGYAREAAAQIVVTLEPPRPDAASGGDAGPGGGDGGCGCATVGGRGSTIPVTLVVSALALGLIARRRR